MGSQGTEGYQSLVGWEWRRAACGLVARAVGPPQRGLRAVGRAGSRRATRRRLASAIRSTGDKTTSTCASTDRHRMAPGPAANATAVDLAELDSSARCTSRRSAGRVEEEWSAARRPGRARVRHGSLVLPGSVSGGRGGGPSSRLQPGSPLPHRLHYQVRLMASTALRAAVRLQPPSPAATGQGGRPPFPDAGMIAEALMPEVLRLVGPSVRRITRELVVPVTSERADVAAIGHATWLFEIKSGRDSLRRLRRQADAFARVADYCVLVAASRHIAGAEVALPPWWGMIEVLDGLTVTLQWRRPPASNPGTDRRTLLLMLRRDEVEAALTSRDGRCRAGHRRMSLLAELDRLLDDDEIAGCVRDAVSGRPQRPGRSAAELLVVA